MEGSIGNPSSNFGNHSESGWDSPEESPWENSASPILGRPEDEALFEEANSPIERKVISFVKVATGEGEGETWIYEREKQDSDEELKKRPAWVPDDVAPECQVCSTAFSVLFRRHHCRACGHVVCGSCILFAPIPRLGYATPVRLCRPCFFRETDLSRSMEQLERSSDSMRDSASLLLGETESALSPESAKVERTVSHLIASPASGDLSDEETVIRPVWMPDASSAVCTRCQCWFNMWNRRHHCRCCGALFCWMCCDFWVSVPRLQYDEPEPLCYVCFMKESQYLSNLDGQMTYLESGGQHDPPIILLNDAMCPTSWLRLQSEVLAAAGFRVFLLEYPGIGVRFYDALTEEKVFESIAKIIETVGKVSLVGYGMGAHVALKFALSHNDLVSNVVAIGMKCSGGPPLKSIVYKHLSRRVAWTMIKTACGIGNETCDLTEDDWNDMKRSGLFFQRFDECMLLETEPKADYYKTMLESQLNSFKYLFISGERDAGAFPVETIIPGATHESIVGRKHWLQVVDLLSEFIRHEAARFSVEDGPKE